MLLLSASLNSQIFKLMRFYKPLLGIGAIFTLSSCIYINVNETSLDYRETKTLTLDAQNLVLLDIDVATGFLIIRGEQNSTQIEVTANIVAVDSNIKFSLESNGNSAILIADANQNNFSSRGIADYPKVDLTLRVPVGINLQIRDGSGSININNISGNVEIDDGSGSIIVSNIGGYVNIKDGSGSMNVTKITGLVTIDDGSGSIDVSQLKGGLTIINEGSGEFRMKDVEGPMKK